MAEGVEFAYIKASEGATMVDSGWVVNSRAAARAGLPFGAYHVLEPLADPTAQAQLFASVARDAGTLPPVLDFELAKGLRAGDALARAVAFLDTIEAAWGRRAVVYTGPSFIAGLVSLGGAATAAPLKALATRPLWVAHYGVPAPKVPAPWTDWSIWQFAGDGGYRMPNGVVVDVDWLRGPV
jgi:GH25 family lysozyme M1 (1,4-beta-N-acetylmuramidase)